MFLHLYSPRPLGHCKKIYIYTPLAANKQRSGRYLQTTKNYALLVAFFLPNVFAALSRIKGKGSDPVYYVDINKDTISLV